MLKKVLYELKKLHKRGFFIYVIFIRGAFFMGYIPSGKGIKQRRPTV